MAILFRPQSLGEAPPMYILNLEKRLASGVLSILLAPRLKGRGEGGGEEE